ncbi:hypothetical protein IAE55_06835 [Paenibacillus sp. S28]|nr:hypothetical protein [Paenibacillus sp. S28]UYO01685.1 hypothetical protein K2F33_17870 [Paenibacillus sp. PSB04]
MNILRKTKRVIFKVSSQGAAIRQHTNTGHTNPLSFSLELGFFAGLLWGAVHWVFHWLRFTIVIPAFLAEPFFKHSFLKSGSGDLLGWLFFIAFSMVAAVIYTLLFRKLAGPWPGIVYGICWWAVLFVAGPALGMMNRLNHLTWNTIITEFCLYLLWGLFIGYTAAFEFTDERKREPGRAKAH